MNPFNSIQETEERDDHKPSSTYRSSGSDSGVSAVFCGNCTTENMAVTFNETFIDSRDSGMLTDETVNINERNTINSRDANTITFTYSIPELALLAPPSSANSHLTTTSGTNSAELSPNFQFNNNNSKKYTDVAMLLENLIQEHIKKDKDWVPSGRYSSTKSSPISMEQSIGDILKKEQVSSSDARTVLERFIERSLSNDPNFRPSGHHRPIRYRSVNSYDVKQKSPETYSDIRKSQSDASHYRLSAYRPMTPIRDLSMNEQNTPDLSRTSDPIISNRYSYYDAIYDDCMNEISEGLSHVAIATPETLGDSEGSWPLTLVALDPGTTTQFGLEDETKTTTVSSTNGVVKVHTHKEVNEVKNSPESSDDDDSPSLQNRKKKTLFTRITERLNRILRKPPLRSDSRSDNEQSLHAVNPRKKKNSKKNGVKLAAVGSQKEVLFEHTHHISLRGVERTGDGLNIALRPSDSESDQKKHRIIRKTKLKNKNINAVNTDKSQVKQKEENMRVFKEMLKEIKKKKKTDRSDSATSSDSIFKRFSLQRKNGSESPSKSRLRQVVTSFRTKGQPEALITEIKKRSKESPSAKNTFPHPSAPSLSRSADHVTVDGHDAQPERKVQTIERSSVLSPSDDEDFGFHSFLQTGERISKKGSYPNHDVRRLSIRSSDRVTAAGSSLVKPSYLPINVDADVHKTIELTTDADGTKHMKSTVSCEELITVDKSGANNDLQKIIDKKYEERTAEEQELVLDEVAALLGRIAKDCSAVQSETQSPQTDNKRFIVGSIPAKKPPVPEVEEPVTLDIKVRGLASYMREKADKINNDPDLAPLLETVASSYPSFEDFANSLTQTESPASYRIATLFSLASSAAHFFGRTSKQANEVKEMVLRYFEDKFANYVHRNGGWDFVIEESSSEMDVD